MVLALTVSASAATTVNLYASGDTHVDGSLPNSNFGGLNYLEVDSNNPERTYIYFDLSSLSGKSIVSAKLHLYMYDAPTANRFYEVYRVGSSWTEMGLKWNNQPDIWYASSGADTGTKNNVWLNWSITPEVQAIVNGFYPNNGWMIKDSDETESKDAFFRSREYILVDVNVSYVPYLEVVYEEPTQECETNDDCREGYVCVEGMCVRQEDVQAPDTDILYLTYKDYVTDPAYCTEWGKGIYTTWVGYDMDIITHGVSEDSESGVKVDTFSPAHVWDQWFTTWSLVNPEDPNGEEAVDWNTLYHQWNGELSEGHHRVCGRAMDVAGNQENPGQGVIDVWSLPNDDCCDVCVDQGGLKPTTVKVVGDPKINWTDAPVEQLENWDGQAWYVTDATTFTLTCTNIHEIPCSPAKEIHYFVDGVETVIQGDTATFNLDGLEEGMHQIDYYCISEAGGIEDTKQELDYLDNTGSTVNKVVGIPRFDYPNKYGMIDPGFFVTNHTQFTFSCDDGSGVDSDIVYWQVEGGISGSGIAPQTVYFNFADGEFNLTYWCVDALGNYGPVKNETDFMDNTAPSIEILEPSQMEHEFGCEADIFTVKASISDLGSGVAGATAEITYMNGTSTGRSVVLTQQQGFWKGNLNHWGLTAGEYLVKVVAWDNVQNTGDKSVFTRLTYDVYFDGCTTFTVPKGQSGSTTFNVNLCHGGNATGLLMTKLCGVIDLSPTITVTGNPVYNIYQEDYYSFISHIFNWPVDGDNFLPLGGTEATVTLTVNVPNDFRCNSNDLRCRFLGYKWGVANEGQNMPLEPSSLLGGIGWFDITCNNAAGTITFGGNCGQGPICGNGMKEIGEQCDGTNGVPASCEAAHGAPESGKHWTGGLSCSGSCTLVDTCAQVSDGGSGGGGGSSSHSSGGSSITCTPQWQCTAPGNCVNGYQFKVCTDMKNCGTTVGRPDEKIACTVEGADNQNGNEAAGSDSNLITGNATKASPAVGIVLIALAAALAVVIAVVARKLSTKKI